MWFKDNLCYVCYYKMEEFRKIQNYNYSVSNMGNVRNSDNLILKTRVGNHGYYIVN